MSLEQRINYQLNKYPGIKKYIKRGYQRTMYALSKKIKSEGDIIRVSPNDPDNEYFFGYYDKSPWDATGRNMLCMRAKDTWTEPDPIGEAEILLIDTEDNNAFRVLATTHTWNVQQGCMAQWLGPDFSSHILFNDLRDGRYCSVVLDVKTGKERVLPMPVYSVSADGKTALTLDFSRLHSLRLGYGYAALPEKTKGVALPEVNHIMISPNGKRFMVLYRWFCGQRKYTRLITCNVDGTDMYVLSDDDMVSHCYWKNDEEIFDSVFEGYRGLYVVNIKHE